MFVVLALFLHMKRRYLGNAKLEETFLYTLKRKIFEAHLANTQCSFPHLKSTLLWSCHSSVKYLCSLLYPNSSKEDFCKISLSSDEVMCMAVIPTLKGRLLSILAWFLANFTIIYIIIDYSSVLNWSYVATIWNMSFIWIMSFSQIWAMSSIWIVWN